MRKAVIISLDAMFDQDIAHLPEDSFLRRMLAEGASCTQVRTVFPALTYPAHCTLITGCDPASHMIGHNQPYQPGVESGRRKWYWDVKQIQKETLFSAVHRQGGKCAAILWPVTGHTQAIRWNFPEVLALPGESQTLKMLAYGSAPWILHMELKHGRERVSTQQPYLSDYAIVLARDVITSHQPDLTCIHLVALDEMRHQHGTYSQEALDALRQLDRHVQTVWETMQQTPGMEDALLFAVSDHGQADIDRTVSLTGVLAENGWGQEVLGVQSNGMSAYIRIDDEDDIPKVKQYITDHAREFGVQRVYDREALDRMGCIPKVDLAVEAMPGVVFSDALEEEKREKATHGFGPGHPAENCLFAAMGKGVRAGAKIDSMPMRSVAPTIAALMGVALPEADGEGHARDMV